MLYAIKRTIEIVEDNLLSETSIKKLVIKLHFPYMVACLSEHVWDWEQNDYRNVEQQNRFLLKNIHDMIKENNREGRLEIKFWLVDIFENLDVLTMMALGDDSPSPQEPPPRSNVGIKFRSAALYWMYHAPSDFAAQQLCRRLGIALEFGTSDTFTGFTAPIRRLVITGEDRAENFARLFGDTWEEAIKTEWDEIRMDVLTRKKPYAGGLHRNESWNIMDEGAPYCRPRLPTAEDKDKIAKLDKKFHLTGDEVSRLHVGRDSGIDFERQIALYYELMGYSGE
ncbi:uncharacterized protein LY89DRAFT_320175 [Mollisia scopiformis]|uniref:Uncharacterized protein n=1 Tax=Mollisia scopiformis TaxID=149040 RepID=A0A132B9N8_MOLSC|nr:uncharacterized protein LY89DRAFT_320175 [Mollisia scopiformis]KUJ09122.1 hypothetical protein LY89DRAFT_320175 [Mollisia scopiformis]